ncbi:MAG: DnaA regulatory inactivator Hda [Gammaproteobacteria bacterium]|nr:DnaA regulatory inactivator Hda [Gammaproteobacteria bacterium]
MSANETLQIKQQLALAMQLNDDASFADFCWTGNELLQQQLLPMTPEPTQRVFYFWGHEGAGKSHLLQAYCQAMSHIQRTVTYVPLKTLRDWDPAVLEGMEAHDVVALDDVDVIAGCAVWEEAVFHLYNRIQERQGVCLFAAQHPPHTITIQLPDLQSRLAAALVLQVHELSDEDKITTLQGHAKKRGLELPSVVGHYIVNRCARNMQDLQAILERLDHASLVAQRKLTIPFVKGILGV